MAIEQRNYSRYLLIKVIVVENNIATFKCCQFEEGIFWGDGDTWKRKWKRDLLLALSKP